MGGFLTTHALDTSRGTPAANLKIDFFEYINGRSNVICSLVTNADGRTDKPVLTETDFRFCLLYTSPSPRDVEESRMPSSA